VLTLTFLGVGSAFAKRNFQSNALIEAWTSGPHEQAAPDDALLIDFGATGPLALHALKSKPEFSYLDDSGSIRYAAIRGVFLTHAHADHIGGLEELAWMSRRARGAKAGPELISTAEVLEKVWSQSLCGGLGVMPGRHTTIEDFFTPRPLSPLDCNGNNSFSILGRYELHAIRTDHVQVQRKYDWPSLGVLFRDKQTSQSALFSGDTRFDSEGLGKYWQESQIIFHEVQLEAQENPVHTLVTDLQGLATDIKRKMWLYHFGDTWDRSDFAFVNREFAGFARPHHRYTLFS